jgi:hypothetical protein
MLCDASCRPGLRPVDAIPSRFGGTDTCLLAALLLLPATLLLLLQEGSLECYLVDCGVPPEDVDRVVTQVGAVLAYGYLLPPCMQTPAKSVGSDPFAAAAAAAAAAASLLYAAVSAAHTTTLPCFPTSAALVPALAGGGVARHPGRPLAD